MKIIVDALNEIMRQTLDDRDEIARLREALHRISLGSQNSGTTKEGLGIEARKALGGE